MKVRVSMPGAYMAIEFGEDEAMKAFRKLNEVLMSLGADKREVPTVTKTKIEPEAEQKNIAAPVETTGGPQGIALVEREDSGIRYKGFLYLKCPQCGEVHGFCTKDYLTYYKCHSCGHKMPFKEPLVRLWVNCECGKEARYMTNLTEPVFDIPCLDCGSPVAVMWNEKKGIYEPVN